MITISPTFSLLFCFAISLQFVCCSFALFCNFNAVSFNTFNTKSLTNLTIFYFLDFQPRPSTSKGIYHLRSNQKRRKAQNTREFPSQDFKNYEALESDSDTGNENEGKGMNIL